MSEEAEVKSFEEMVEEVIAADQAAESAAQQPVAVVSVLDVESVSEAVEAMKSALTVIEQLKASVEALAERVAAFEGRYEGLQEELSKTQKAVIKFADHVAAKLQVQVTKKAVDLAEESLLERSAVKSQAVETVKVNRYFPNNAPGG
jgi:class 3 adenylate cyclase